MTSVETVSIHAPARGATAGRHTDACRCGCFNPRPRAGGDTESSVIMWVTDSVSIHAPARGATEVLKARRAWRHVSIHAPARGATPASAYRAIRMDGFNPRPRAGGDAEVLALDVNGWAGFNPRPRAGGDWTTLNGLTLLTDVSIHAPARGATCCADVGSLGTSLVSIHAPARGATRIGCTDGGLRGWFQSTPPRGGRLQLHSKLTSVGKVSIHAPARGATHRLIRDATDPDMFQSTPPRGGRPDAI